MAVYSSEGSSTLAVWLAFLVLQTGAIISAVAVTFVKAATGSSAIALVTKLAGTAEGIWGLEKTVGIFIAQFSFAFFNHAAVRALRGTGCSNVAVRVAFNCAGVGWAVDTLGLLGLWLVLAHWAFSTFVVIEILARHADWQVAVFFCLGARLACCSVQWALLAPAVSPLCSVRSNGTHLALCIDA